MKIAAVATINDVTIILSVFTAAYLPFVIRTSVLVAFFKVDVYITFG